MTHTAFSQARRIASGTLAEVVVAARTHADVLIFEDRSGKQVDVDMRGSEAQIRERFQAPARGPGRPRMGVTAREVTLLPRHWDWLAAQSGGASVALRKLVEAASRSNQTARDQAREAAYCFATAMAGNRVGYEEAIRALYAGKRAAFFHQLEYWPADIRAHLEGLTQGLFPEP